MLIQNLLSFPNLSQYCYQYSETLKWRHLHLYSHIVQFCSMCTLIGLILIAKLLDFKDMVRNCRFFVFGLGIGSESLDLVRCTYVIDDVCWFFVCSVPLNGFITVVWAWARPLKGSGFVPSARRPSNAAGEGTEACAIPQTAWHQCV